MNIEREKQYARSSNKLSTAVVHKKLENLHYHIAANAKIVKIHLYQLPKNNIKPSVTAYCDIINNFPTKEVCSLVHSTI